MTAATHSDLDAIYRTHASWLLNWLANRARASDLAQETFCRLAEQPALRLREHPRRYLATVIDEPPENGFAQTAGQALDRRTTFT
ncbi:hypothetical protein ACFB49_06550 [Sphingomonas sp. DBB INV C78]|uniref:hypothetical protein n=1 Tax=Sphingomonas sp. DBB INV C78 TaxID=3349434 RepID=UPI0036D3309A